MEDLWKIEVGCLLLAIFVMGAMSMLFVIMLLHTLGVV